MDDSKTALPILRGEKILEDDEGNICLNDLWRLAGSPENLRPTNWRRQKRTQALEAALVDRIMFLKHNYPKNSLPTVYYVQARGKAAKTFAHPVLALDYAECLNPEIGVEIREMFLRFRATDIGLANDILDRIGEQIKEDQTRVHNRAEISARNKDLAAQGARAGCVNWQYAELHNAGYRGLYNGLEEDEIHELKGLTKNQRILDHMCAAEGAANVFRVTQAALRMKRLKPKTPEEAFDIAHEAGVRTRQAMEEIGGVMPEEMEAADSISTAKKRLEKNLEIVARPGMKKLV
ncbi:MAG: KilA-N domain-containing protein [Hyphomonadaceae bacterium]